MTYACQKYIVDLTPEERQTFEQLTSKGKAPVYKINHARILLKADINSTQGEWTDQAISQALDISPATIERCGFVEQGMEAALNRQVQQNANPGDSTVNKRICSRCCVVNTRRPRTLDAFVSRADSGVMWRAFPMKQ